MSREPLFSASGVPCIAPPWAVLTAVDLGTGKIRWETPLGTTEGRLPIDPPANYGVAGLGGPIITAGGLVFIGAAWDGYFRGFDVGSGKELWKSKLPAPGVATPMTYRVRPNGKQFVVIAAGGHGKLPIPLGDAVVAFYAAIALCAGDAVGGQQIHRSRNPSNRQVSSSDARASRAQ
jgi:quinoprotein glucose dehydrogenase